MVDDEEPSREALVTYLRDFCPEVEVVAECDSVKSAYQAIRTYKPALVFLDIDMPNGNGFDLLQMFRQPDFRVIFVTAFSEYALRAFRFSAVDYLLKPVKVDELVEAVSKVRAEASTFRGNLNLEVLMETISQQHPNPRLVIPNTKGFVVVDTNELIMCEADAYCTIFHLTGKRKICSTKNLKYYEELFDTRQFIRAHRSHLVNLVHVKGYSHQGEIHLAEDLRCPLGDNYKNRFIRLMNLG